MSRLDSRGDTGKAYAHRGMVAAGRNRTDMRGVPASCFTIKLLPPHSPRFHPLGRSFSLVAKNSASTLQTTADPDSPDTAAKILRRRFSSGGMRTHVLMFAPPCSRKAFLLVWGFARSRCTRGPELSARTCGRRNNIGICGQRNGNFQKTNVLNTD